MKVLLMKDEQISGFEFEEAIVNFSTRLALAPEQVREVVYSEFQPGGLIDRYRLGWVTTPDFMIELSEALDKMPVDVLNAWLSLISLDQDKINNLNILLNNMCYPNQRAVHVISSMTPTHHDVLLGQLGGYNLELSSNQFTVAFQSQTRSHNMSYLKQFAEQDIKQLYGSSVVIEDLTDEPAAVEGLVSDYLDACKNSRIQKFK